MRRRMRWSEHEDGARGGDECGRAAAVHEMVEPSAEDGMRSSKTSTCEEIEEKKKKSDNKSPGHRREAHMALARAQTGPN